ncbi:MAG: hypothetical protein EBR23_08275, partial [Planctomycetia bacterium]|nr:hypothetical protein [Planctomycetia bacterium]
KNTAGITSYGGGLQFNNTSSQGVVYAETVGALGLNAGQFDVYLNTDMAGGAGTSGPTNSQTLTFGGLSQSGTGTVTFAVPNAAGPNGTTNIVAVTGATQTPTGQIIGPWAVVGVNNQQYNDYAAYNAAGQIVPAAIADSAETTWTNAANAYTMGTALGNGSDKTLTATRTVAALRDQGNNNSLNLQQFNLETNGLFAYTQNNWNINTTGGVIRQNGTAAGNLFVTTSNQGGIIINAPIANNTGALTLVKSGYQNLYLRGVNTYTGGTVLNAGTTYVNASSAAAFGTGTITFAGGTLDNDNVQLPAFSNPVVLNGYASYNGAGSSNMIFSGPVSLGTTPGAWRTINVNANNLVLGGVVSNGSTVTSIEKTGGGSLILANQNTYTGDTILTGGTIQLAAGNVGTLGAITTSPVGTGRLVFNGGGLSSNGVAPRTILNPVAFNSGPGNTSAVLGNAANNGLLTFSAGIDLGFAPRVINTPSAVQFDGVVSGTSGVFGGGVGKTGQGVLTLTNAANSYQGLTAVAGGVLRPTVVGAIPANTNLVVAANSSTNTATLDLATNSIDLTVGAVQIGGVSNIFGNNNAFNSTASSYSLINTGSATLTLGGDLTFANGQAAYTAAIQGKLALGSLNLTINNPVVNSIASTPYFARNFAINDSANAARFSTYGSSVSPSFG